MLRPLENLFREPIRESNCVEMHKEAWVTAPETLCKDDTPKHSVLPQSISKTHITLQVFPWSLRYCSNG